MPVISMDRMPDYRVRDSGPCTPAGYRVPMYRSGPANTDTGIMHILHYAAKHGTYPIICRSSSGNPHPLKPPSGIPVPSPVSQASLTQPKTAHDAREIAGNLQTTKQAFVARDRTESRT
ncbi:MAG: hypothetical protein ACYC0V_16865 [Armatimonadota bacterium]